MAFHHMDQAAAPDLPRSHAAQALAGEIDGPGVPWQQARDGAEQCGLARAVRAQQGHQLAGCDVQIDPVQDADLAVTGMQALDPQKGFSRRDRH
jgi:hypothetical protein